MRDTSGISRKSRSKMVTMTQVEQEGLSKAESTTMLCDTASPPEDPSLLTAQELELVCELFYLPWEHGPKVSIVLLHSRYFTRL